MKNPGDGRAWKCTKRAACAFVGLAFLLGGCGLGPEFRAAAGPALETGVNSILDGLVSGIFAVVKPDSTATNGSTSDNSSPSGN